MMKKLMLLDGEDVKAVRVQCPGCELYEWRVRFSDEKWLEVPLCPCCVRRRQIGDTREERANELRKNTGPLLQEARSVLEALGKGFTIEVCVEEPESDA